MLPGIRQRVISRIYGDGFAAMVAAALTERALAQLRAAVRHEPELLDVSKLVPGESYVVTTRPAPTRKERKLEKASLTAHRKLEKATRPTRSQRRLERQLVRSSRAASKATVGTRRWARATAQVQRQERELVRQLRPSAKTRKLQASSDAIDAELERRRTAALLEARRKARPPRARVFR